MHTSGTSGRVTSSGDVDKNGDLVGYDGMAIDRGPYIEREGLDQRIEAAGADVHVVRRMLGLEAVA